MDQMDVCAAFLHGTLDQNVYINIPANDNKVFNLKKALYGLKQAPYCWNKKFNELCLYIKKSDNKINYLLLYVDDLIIAGNCKDNIDSVKLELSNAFRMYDLGELKHFLGITVRRVEDGIYLNQKHYILNILKRFGMEDCRECKTPMDPKLDIHLLQENAASERPIRELVGSITHLMLCTRPDLSSSINICSRYQDKPSEALWTCLKRILRYIKGTADFELCYNKCNEKLIGYADSDLGGDATDRKSTSGYPFKVFGCLVSWNTKKQKCVAISSTEAEYLALAEAVKEGIWLENLLTDFGCAKTGFIVFEDNQSCIKLTSKYEHKRLKHIDIKYNFLNDLVINKTVKVEYICTKNQIADILTKCLVGELFVKHRYDLGLRKETMRCLLMLIYIFVVFD